MNGNVSFSQDMDALFSELKDFVKTESIMGTPLPVGDNTLIPVVSVTLGYGSGNNAKNANANAAPGVGIGAKVCTNAVVVVNKDNVSMLPVNGKGNMDQVMNNIPQMISNLKQSASQQNMPQGQQNQPQQNNQNQQQNKKK
ncbi:sporulation protein YtfJ [Clostridium acetireducens DSM 10703]|jgi:uncharacterized spore protein YtfJ|uniref:Sporulation protein YtfJ n=1 Tax=Clostridium acetireducens DSM 10703 TaxID=1121290 RepID=A0A1E8EY19_9CLOT|nr:spore germination protein GerW family protein [Clostridium acetireducens]OFI05841.1 sporulation protein YtfJ [Clostridium acetireducens DSM 10703]